MTEKEIQMQILLYLIDMKTTVLKVLNAINRHELRDQRLTSMIKQIQF